MDISVICIDDDDNMKRAGDFCWWWWFGFFSSFSSSKKIKIIYLIDDYDEYVPIGSSNGNASCRCCCYCLLMNFICKFFFFFGNKLFTVVGFDEYFVDYDDDDCYLMIFVQNPYITHTHTYTRLYTTKQAIDQ